jgi:hypothetical protein
MTLFSLILIGELSVQLSEAICSGWLRFPAQQSSEFSKIWISRSADQRITARQQYFHNKNGCSSLRQYGTTGGKFLQADLAGENPCKLVAATMLCHDLAHSKVVRQPSTELIVAPPSNNVPPARAT